MTEIRAHSISATTQLDIAPTLPYLVLAGMPALMLHAIMLPVLACPPMSRAMMVMTALRIFASPMLEAAVTRPRVAVVVPIPLAPPAVARMAMLVPTTSAIPHSSVRSMLLCALLATNAKLLSATRPMDAAF